jgi:hypothetical protein
VLIQSTVLVGILALGSAAQAATYTVTSTASSGPGSFRQAIVDSNSPAGGVNTIVFSAAFPDNDVVQIDTSLPLINSQSLTILGGSKAPTIDGQSLYAMLRVTDLTTTLALSDLTLSRGFSVDSGGCIHAGNGTAQGALQLERVTLSQCKASGTTLARGGAIAWIRNAGSVSLIDSQLTGNTVTATGVNGESYGGALYSTSSLTALRTVLESNSTDAKSGGGAGGAILLGGDARSSSITESTLRFNFASPSSSLLGYGGGVALLCDNCSLQLVRSYLALNFANFGGSVFSQKPGAGVTDVFVTLANSTFNNSVADNQGGAVWTGSGASLSATNNTIYQSDAVSGADFGFGAGSKVNYFRANLLAPTASGSACSGSPTISNPGFVGSNLFADASCPAIAAGALPNTPIGTVTLDEEPGKIRVLRFSGSAVIDSIADGSVCEPLDARFQSRPLDGDDDGTAYCDVGAYELLGDSIFADGFDL